jgi:uncharacterized protein
MEDGTTLLFNFYTLNLITLDRFESASVDRILKNPDSYRNNENISGLFELLFEKGFILDDEINELELLKYERYRSCADQKNLTLTILPSLACNFRCAYCYQEEKTQKMSQEIEEAIIRLVKKRIQRGGSLSVDWFGGEPLLQMDIIERLSKEFIQICRDNDASYQASIVTNGYLLNTKLINKLIELKITRAQITLDGPPEVHDKRRTLKGGQKTFRTIFNNIKKASSKMNITLRMNVDETNRDNIKDMIEILVKEGLEKRLGFYLGRTYPYTEVCNDIATFCLADEDFSLLGLETLMLLVDQDFSSTYWMPSSKSSYCTVDKKNSYVITPSGGIVNCWNETADPEKEIGHLVRPKTEKMNEKTREWQQCDLFDRDECMNCILLPICMGGCPYIFRTTGKNDCHKWKYHLKESIAFYYYYKTKQRERIIAHRLQKAVEAVKKLKDAAEGKD